MNNQFPDTMKMVKASEKHQAIMKDFKQVLLKHKTGLSGEEVLAVTSCLVGHVIALLDPKEFTPTMAMEIVSKNITQGNQTYIEEFFVKEIMDKPPQDKS